MEASASSAAARPAAAQSSSASVTRASVEQRLGGPAVYSTAPAHTPASPAINTKVVHTVLALAPELWGFLAKGASPRSKLAQEARAADSAGDGPLDSSRRLSEVLRRAKLSVSAGLVNPPSTQRNPADNPLALVRRQVAEREREKARLERSSNGSPRSSSRRTPVPTSEHSATATPLPYAAPSVRPATAPPARPRPVTPPAALAPPPPPRPASAGRRSPQPLAASPLRQSAPELRQSTPEQRRGREPEPRRPPRPAWEDEAKPFFEARRPLSAGATFRRRRDLHEGAELPERPRSPEAPARRKKKRAAPRPASAGRVPPPPTARIGSFWAEVKAMVKEERARAAAVDAQLQRGPRPPRPPPPLPDRSNGLRLSSSLAQPRVRRGPVLPEPAAPRPKPKRAAKKKKKGEAPGGVMVPAPAPEAPPAVRVRVSLAEIAPRQQPPRLASPAKGSPPRAKPSVKPAAPWTSPLAPAPATPALPPAPAPPSDGGTPERGRLIFGSPARTPARVPPTPAFAVDTPSLPAPPPPAGPPALTPVRVPFVGEEALDTSDEGEGEEEAVAYGPEGTPGAIELEGVSGAQLEVVLRLLAAARAGTDALERAANEALPPLDLAALFALAQLVDYLGAPPALPPVAIALAARITPPEAAAAARALPVHVLATVCEACERPEALLALCLASAAEAAAAGEPGAAVTAACPAPTERAWYNQLRAHAAARRAARERAEAGEAGPLAAAGLEEGEHWPRGLERIDDPAWLEAAAPPPAAAALVPPHLAGVASPLGPRSFEAPPVFCSPPGPSPPPEPAEPGPAPAAPAVPPRPRPFAMVQALFGFLADGAAGEAGGLPAPLAALEAHGCGPHAGAYVKAALALGRLGPQTRRLDLRGCASLPEPAVAAAVRACPAARHLDLSGCTSVTDGTLLAVAAAMPALESLQVAGCRQLTDAGFAAFAAACSRRLAARALDAALTADPSGASGAASLPPTRPPLRALNLQACSALGDGALAAIATHFGDLEDLCLYGCYRATDRGALALGGAAVPRLRRLNHAGAYKLSHAAVRFVLGSHEQLLLYTRPELFGEGVLDLVDVEA